MSAEAIEVGRILALYRDVRIHLQASPGARQSFCGETRILALTAHWTETTCRRCLVARDKAERVKVLRFVQDLAKKLVYATDDERFEPGRGHVRVLDFDDFDEAVEAEFARICEERP